MAVKVQFEIGHTSKLRTKKTPEGFTHDWEIYVQGVNKADISAFVDKVVFMLHESFPKPKRVIKEPPYAIQESGYAGFILPVEIFFRNRDEPKRIMYQYDLDLQQTGPPHHRVEIKTHVFEAPSEEFRIKLMRGGGVPVFGANVNALNRNVSPSVGELVASESSMGKQKTSSSGSMADPSKKHKSRTDDGGKTSSFSKLFGPPISKGGSGSGANVLSTSISKHSPDGKSSSGSIKSGSSHDAKDKANKEREKSCSLDKSRDKEKKDRHGRDRERKSCKSSESSNRHDKDKEKSKKDKTRDKEREREQSCSTTTTPAISAGKRPLSPKTNKNNIPESNVPSPKKLANDVSGLPGSRSKDREEHKSIKSELKDKERSSNKKSKKEKKDKDREREREKREESKDKRLLKEDRGSTDSPGSGNHLQPNTTSTYEVLKTTGKATPTSIGSNSSSSFVSNGGKRNHDKDEQSKSMEKTSEQKTDKSISNNSSVDKKSHKHKKKEKSKDKERNERDKDRDKERDKEKQKEREKEKAHQSTLKEASPKTGNGSPASSALPERAADKICVSNAASSSGNVNTNKRDRHKKPKEKSSCKEEKRHREASDKSDSKHTGKQQLQTKAPNNLDLSDMDSAHSTSDLAATNALAAATAATLQHSDSSNSSFPDLSAKISQKQIHGTKGSAIASPGTKDTKSSGKEQLKSRNVEKGRGNDRSEKNIDKIEKPSETKGDKLDKEEKKRNRRNSSSGVGGSTFIEPPVKPTKKDLHKASREKSTSPSCRTAVNTANHNVGFLPPPSSGINNTNHASIPSPINNNSASSAGTTNNSADMLSQSFTSQTSASVLPTEYLSELQELHQKIMTLQDNEELQHVATIVAATGCYEVTHKTFDFDLCKLDRGTVQRLQEFLATSVS